MKTHFQMTENSCFLESYHPTLISRSCILVCYIAVHFHSACFNLLDGKIKQHSKTYKITQQTTFFSGIKGWFTRVMQTQMQGNHVYTSTMQTQDLEIENSGFVQKITTIFSRHFKDHLTGM